MRVCTVCHRPLRRTDQPIKDFPGTIVGIGTLCITHRSHKLGRNKPKNAPRPPVVTAKEAQTIANTPANRASLAAYLEWRRPYRLKAGNP